MLDHDPKVPVKSDLLYENVEQYHKMIEEVEDYAILLLDKDGIIRNWNKGAEKIKGYTEQEIIGKSFKIFYPKEDQARNLPEQLITEAAQNGRAIHEGWRVRKNGTHFWGSVVITALHDEEQNIIGFTKVTRDLTERKKSEENLMQYANDLSVQNKELEQFAFVASHDMKEPLRKILLYSALLKEKIFDMVGEKEQDYLDRVIHSAEKMQRLINDLLSYSRTSFKNDVKDDVDLNAVVKEVTDSYNDRLEPINGRIVSDILPVIKGTGFQLVQLFDNLINNAIKYKSAKRDLQININYEKVANSLHKISVSDNGIGFDMEFSQKIFDLFQRLENSDDTGTGIGLAICKKIMQNHKGDVRVSSQPNNGAVFQLYFPV
jgi:PAS domain S-box-containing protein